ncbi:Segregation and condensation protein B [Austwickia sp. TVS 96-490-7B]|uniref:SMC-Scp complex subunit ScpB n=1 Tax=Austwickia sp. TVS 96-490-7B TaxID=2830843 RepID=UPI001DBD5A24|nr:SMC-Scp complex subunit ScpB [Austwickia sp. TVS 96-490-7B]MBW3086292.1 Segregation and condensation protein B [Austwickia sp. TVS 96-490-7B]
MTEHEVNGATQGRRRPDVDVWDLPGGPRAALEAVLMVVEEPVGARDLAEVLGLPATQVKRLLQDLAEEYARDRRGFDLRQVDQGWRFYSRFEYAEVVERFVMDGQRARLSQAALETLAVIAYRQPVSRARVSAVRGVNVDGVVRTLLTRGLIREVGTDPDHGAVVYGTTEFFLDRLGLASLDELPALAPYLPDVDMLDEIAREGGT